MRSLYLFAIFYSCTFFAQDKIKPTLDGVNKYEKKYNDEFNLKGPVKEIKTLFISNSELPKYVQDLYIEYDDIPKNGYEFYENGFFKYHHYTHRNFDTIHNRHFVPSMNHYKIVDSLNNSRKTNKLVNQGASHINVIDSIDLKNKMSYKPKYSFFEKIGKLGGTEDTNGFDIYKLNVNFYYLSNSWKNKDSLNKLKSLIFNQFYYKFDAKGRIINQKEYQKYISHCENYKDTLKMFYAAPHKHLIDKEDYKYEWEYFYDQKDRIIKLVQHLRYVDYEYNILNIINKLTYEFDYNEQDQVIETRHSVAAIRSPLEHLITHKYYYHPTEKYLQTVEILLDRDFFHSTFWSPEYDVYLDYHTKKHYNAHGNIIKRDFLGDGSKMLIAKKEINNRKAPRYFEYVYDKYNNWTTCAMYLYDDKSVKAFEIKREITYYEE